MNKNDCKMEMTQRETPAGAHSTAASHGQWEGDGNLYDYNLTSEEEDGGDRNTKKLKVGSALGSASSGQAITKQNSDRSSLNAFEVEDECGDEEEALLGTDSVNTHGVQFDVLANKRRTETFSLLSTMSLALCGGILFTLVVLFFVANFYYRLRHIKDMPPGSGPRPPHEPNERRERIQLPEQRILMQTFVTGISEKFLDQIEGCWKVCYDSDFSQISTDSLFDDCKGEWVFVYTRDDYAPHPEIIFAGAFGRKSVLLNPVVSNFSCTVAGADCEINGIYEGGVYWYKQTNEEYGYSSFGFSTSSGNILNWNYGYIDVGQITGCGGSISWSFSDRSNSPSAVNCIASADARYRKRIVTNMCRVPDPE
jgi:hypothetical protein